jgi:hypothetical protein
MPLTDPGTRSEYKLVLFYSDTDVVHQVGVNAVVGLNPDPIDPVRTDAEDLAALVAACLPNSRDVVSWALQDPTGLTLWAEAFPTPYSGTHGTSPSLPDYRSTTVNILGKGNPVIIGGASGRVGFRLFTGNAYFWPSGAKYLSTPVDLPMGSLIGWLNSNLRWFADFYGQHADTTGLVAVQFHAHTQRVAGS